MTSDTPDADHDDTSRQGDESLEQNVQREAAKNQERADGFYQERPWWKRTDYLLVSGLLALTIVGSHYKDTIQNWLGVNDAKTYTVQQGDNLWNIAKKHIDCSDDAAVYSATEALAAANSKGSQEDFRKPDGSHSKEPVAENPHYLTPGTRIDLSLFDDYDCTVAGKGNKALHSGKATTAETGASRDSPAPDNNTSSSSDTTKKGVAAGLAAVVLGALGWGKKWQQPDPDPSGSNPEDFYSRLLEDVYRPARASDALFQNASKAEQLSTMRQDISSLINNYNTGHVYTDNAWAPNKRTATIVMNQVRQERLQQPYDSAEGPVMTRFNKDMLSDGELCYLNDLYRDASLTLDEVKERFAETTQMGVSKSTLYRMFGARHTQDLEEKTAPYAA